jgi:hypothetical protein
MNAASVACVMASVCESVLRLMSISASRDDESFAERGKEALRERADVKDTTFSVERLQRIVRASVVEELTVVVVFDHHRIDFMRACEQGSAAHVLCSSERMTSRRQPWPG